ncbi:MAG: hypothetical protein QOH92_2693 [Chloroflexota bacterium]|jgi:hypothetical protein|nr:hypothetical protein [Chloroflexota bacterium]
MNLRPPLARSLARFLALALLPASVAGITSVGVSAGKSTPSSTCLTGPVKHVIYLQFDNTHFNRDRSNVASDLEQMPHLLNFLKSNGTLFTNDHTILISHTAGGILSSLTGLYPDRQGQTVSNSYDFYPSTKLPRFTSSFKYWTNPVDPALDTLPNMITDGQKNTPAPWVPYTRAGCDFGGVATANIELENANQFATGDVAQVFGNPSPQLTEAKTQPGLAQTDFVGIAIHCSQATDSKCAGNTSAKPDSLKDEPGGYVGYNALYGAKYVDPAITGGNPCVNDTAGQPITDPAGNCGFPGFDGMLAKNTLGYVEQMQAAGVPITYGYISDAHDIHVPNVATDSYDSHANGPGEADFKGQLAAYDNAFAAFFDHLASNGIDKSNTLFVVTVDEGDHFAGGIGTPQADGSFSYSHANCANLAACPTNQLGEVNADVKGLLAAQSPDPIRPGFDIHFDDAPTFYVNGQPGRTDPKVRKLERDVASLTSLDPYTRDSTGNVQSVSLTRALADPVEEQALHMINTDPNRTPTFTWFANPDFFFQTSPPSCGGNPCVNPKFAWNHGDIQAEIGNTWVGLVGPGIAQRGIDASTWTDHTNLRPTMLTLIGLRDDYQTDGRVLIEALNTSATPQTLIAHRETVRRLGAIYEQVNASFGQFSMDTLVASTRALKSTDESVYSSIEDSIASLASQRDSLASQIKVALSRAAFDGQALNEQQAKDWIAQAQSLLDQATALAG